MASDTAAEALHPFGIHLPGSLRANARCGFSLHDLVQELSHNSVSWGRPAGERVRIRLCVITFRQLRPFLAEAVDDEETMARIVAHTPSDATFLVHADDGSGMTLQQLKISNLQGHGNKERRPASREWWPCALNPAEDDGGRRLLE